MFVMASLPHCLMHHYLRIRTVQQALTVISKIDQPYAHTWINIISAFHMFLIFCFGQKKALKNITSFICSSVSTSSCSGLQILFREHWIWSWKSYWKGCQSTAGHNAQTYLLTPKGSFSIYWHTEGTHAGMLHHFLTKSPKPWFSWGKKPKATWMCLRFIF